jgi:hypothetical protein
MQTANIRQGMKPKPPARSSDHRYSTKAGATPKHRKSARLSNSAPKRDTAFSSRASLPSSPSMQAATVIATTAAPKRPSSA